MSVTANAARAARNLLVDVATACDMLSISRTTLWSLTSTGALRSVNIGRSRRFRVSDLEAFVATLAAEA